MPPDLLGHENEHRCPTCGSRVRVVSSGEGTSSYVPAPEGQEPEDVKRNTYTADREPGLHVKGLGEGQEPRARRPPKTTMCLPSADKLTGHEDDEGVSVGYEEHVVRDTDANGNTLRLRWSERNMLRFAREHQRDTAQAPSGALVEHALANDLVTVLERLGRLRAASALPPREAGEALREAVGWALDRYDADVSSARNPGAAVRFMQEVRAALRSEALPREEER